MKKLLATLAALVTLTLSASAMSYEQARERALFLTDKMAYELNLTDDQYEAAYEINLDYLMSINDYNDLYGTYWRQRNLDLSYILLDWQYRTYCAASYFYRPLYWQAGCWHFGIYARYPHRTYFYFGRPHFYAVYRGGHSWRTNGGRSWYHGRTYGGPHPNGHKRVGMRDGFDRGDFGRGYHGDQPARFGNGTRQHGQPGNSNNNHNNNNGRPQSGNRTFGNGNRQSSTRTTVTRPSSRLSDSKFNGSRSVSTNGKNTIAPNVEKSNPTQRSFSGGNSSSGSRSFGGSKNSSSSRSFGSGQSSFGSRSFGGSKSSSSFRSFGGGSRNSGSRSFGGGSSSSSTRSFGGGSSSHNGGHFGGRR